MRSRCGLPFALILEGTAKCNKSVRANAMKREGHNLPAGDNFGADITPPRFDEQAKEAARPVVPLERVDNTDFDTGSAGGQRANNRHARKVLTRGLVVML